MTDDFLNVIDELTVGSIIRTRLDDGTVHIERHDALLKQLREAVASSLVGGSVAAGGKTTIPINSDALELYQGIEHSITEQYAAEGLGVPGLFPEETLRALYTHRWADGDDDAETVARQWRASIHNLFDPPKKVPLRDPCPVCKATHYYNEQGDLCANPVVITYRVGDPIRTVKAVCHANSVAGPCGTEWVGADAVEELIGELRELFTEDTP